MTVEQRRADLTVAAIRALGVPRTLHSDFELSGALTADRNSDLDVAGMAAYDRRVLINVLAHLVAQRAHLDFRDPDGSGFCPRCHYPVAVHPLDAQGDDVGRCPDQVTS